MAGRSRVGRRAWVDVQSRCKVAFRTGVMPSGGMRLVQASCDQLLAAVKLLFTVLRWSEPEAEEIFVGVPPPNKLVGVPDLELKSFLPHFFSSCHGGGLEEEGGKGFCCSILSACPWSPSFAANGWGSWCREHHEILATAPLHLLVERRPLGVLATTSGSCISSRPPSHMGGSLTCSSTGTSTVYLRLFAGGAVAIPPPQVVSSPEVVGSGQDRRRRRGLDCFSVLLSGVLSTKMSGLGCNFLFLLGLHVRCCMLI
ncbi:hypothetical protein VPH35_064843 [Triticum aestivum]